MRGNSERELSLATKLFCFRLFSRTACLDLEAGRPCVTVEFVSIHGKQKTWRCFWVKRPWKLDHSLRLEHVCFYIRTEMRWYWFRCKVYSSPRYSRLKADGFILIVDFRAVEDTKNRFQAYFTDTRCRKHAIVDPCVQELLKHTTADMKFHWGALLHLREGQMFWLAVLAEDSEGDRTYFPTSSTEFLLLYDVHSDI
jgi:hypothetical protein